MTSILYSVLSFVVAIAVLVAIHEYGHYIVARWCGVKVLRYSIGFGKPLWLTRRGPDQTEYCVSAIPLGGYVKLLDEREGNVPEEDLHRSFNRQSTSAKVAILAAGPGFNFIFAVAAFWAMFMLGVPGLKPVIGAVDEASPAWAAGVRSGDEIRTVGDSDVATWDAAVLAILDEMLDGGEIGLTVAAGQGAERRVVIDVVGRTSELTEPGALLPGLGLSPWRPVIPAVIGEIEAGAPADQAGVKSGDLVLELDGEAVADWPVLVDLIRARPDADVELVVERNGVEKSLALRIGSRDEGGTVIGRIGAGVDVPEGLYDDYEAEQRYPAGQALTSAVSRTWEMSVLTLRMIGRMITGDVSVKNISGPINIAQYAGYSAQIGFAQFLSFLAVVSLSLGILNLLPVPILDGGQILYQLAAAVKGGPLPERWEIVGQQLGILLLVMIMSFAFYNDLSRIFG